jgi:pimeloyl-ACP methyl ester carboxylesterase
MYLGDELSRISQPTLMVWSEHDCVPVEEARTAAARMPNGSVHYLPGVGHFPFLQAAEETARIAREFVARNAPAPSVA